MISKQTPTMGEVLQTSKRNSARAVVQGVMIGIILVVVVYTGVHNFNLFRRSLPTDQQLFALIPVVALEGSILILTIGGFVWFAGGAQKIVATLASWLMLVVVALNTLVDSTYATNDKIPDWLNVYAQFVMYAMPVAVLAVLKLIFDLDPAKRKLDMEKQIEYALDEAKFAALQKALMSDVNRAALADYGSAMSGLIASSIRQSPQDVAVALPQVRVMNASDDAGAKLEPSNPK